MPSLTSLRAKMKQFDLSALYIDDPIHITYLTGLKVSRGIILISMKRAWILLDSRYGLGLSSSSRDAEWVTVVADETSVRDQLLRQELTAIDGVVGFDGQSVCFRQAEHLRTLCGSSCSLNDAKALFAILRRPKDEKEIAKISAACQLCCAGFSYLLQQIREGVSERELALQLTLFWLQQGADCLSFDPIIAFGPNSACPHWKSGETKLEPNSIILIDIGVQLEGYQSDMTRVVFFKEVSQLLRKYALHVEEAYTIAAQAALPGVLPYSLDEMVRNYFGSVGLKEAFVHGLGHGVGLQIHESPRLNPNNPHEQALIPGDIITIEPGLYCKGQGGIRLENTCLVTEEGAISLMELPLAPFQL